jgi:hypothetical protein
MKIPLYLIAMTLIFGSCQSDSTKKKESQQKIDTGETSNVIVSDAKDNTPSFASFEEFWKSFRQAVLNADTAQIIALTKFPFETRGPLDSDPTIKYSKQKFPHVFQAFLNQWNGMDLEGTTELETIKKTTIISKEDIADEYTRVGNLVFNKTKDGWRLVFAYLNNETIDAL